MNGRDSSPPPILVNALIVPINVQALTSTSHFTQPAGPRVDYTQLPDYGIPGSPPTAATVDCSQINASGGPAEGVLLHWALPGAMGTQRDWSAFMPGDETRASLLPAPDQWAIIRWQPGSGHDPQIVIVDSGFLSLDPPIGSPGMAPATVPKDLSKLENSDPAYHYLGRSLYSNEWQAPDPRECLPVLTAAGRGQASFAGYLPDCINVFGMLDVNITSGAEASYLVVGWYRDPANDPLACKQRTAGELLGTLNWSIPGAADTDPAPTRTVFAGMISGVAPGSPQTMPDASVDLALGATAASALATLVANANAADVPINQPGGVSGFARALTALLYGSLDLCERPDATALIDDLIHRAGFHTLTHGATSNVRQKRTAPGGASDPSLPPAMAAAQLRANRVELELHAGQRVTSALDTQLYWDWQNYIMTVYQGADSQTLISAMQALLESGPWAAKTPTLASSRVIANQETRVAHRQSTVTALVKALEEHCFAPQGDREAHTRYEIARFHTPPFCTPLDPALALRGASLAGPDRIGGSLPGNGLPPLIVRTTDQLLIELCVGEGTAGAKAACHVTPPLNADTHLPALLKGLPPALPNQELVQLLFAEQWLLDPLNAAALAAGLGNGVDPTALEGTLASQFSQGSVAAGLSYRSWAGEVTALPPVPALTAWNGNPWLPVFLRWSAALTPVATTQGDVFPSTAITANFILSTADTDLQPVTPPSLGPATNPLIGLGTFTTSLSDSLSASLETAAAIDGVTPTDLKAISDALDGTPIHTCHLDGFFDQALQLQRQPQIPPADFINAKNVPGADATCRRFTGALAAARRGPTGLGLQTTSMPAYAPVANGPVSGLAVQVVDCFGQVLQLTPDNIYCDDILATDVKGADFFLPPRLAYPARLLTRWMAPLAGEDDDLPDNPTEAIVNPIRGWIVPVPANNGFQVIAASGTPLLEIMGGDEGVTFAPTPGSPITAGGSGAAALKAALIGVGADLVLVAFAAALAGLTPGALQPLAQILADKVAAQAPEDSLLAPPLAALVGRPLAVVQARLALELFGPPPPPQSADAFTRYVATMNGLPGDATDVPVRDPAKLLGVAFPVLLGDDARVNDGLYAYINPGNGTGICVSTADALPAGCTPASPSTFSLTATGDETDVAMLIDPSAPVHISTGILPVQTLKVPPAFYRQALHRIHASLFAAPLLSTMPPNPPQAPALSMVQASALPMMTPGIGKGRWTFARRIDNDGTPVWATPVATLPLDPGALTLGGPPALVEGWLVLPRETDA